MIQTPHYHGSSSYEGSSSHYKGADTSSNTLTKNDPDSYYDHYEYGDNPNILMIIGIRWL